MTSKAELEAHLEKRCVLYAEAFDFDSIKLDNAKRSWPDRLFLGPGTVRLLVEFKRPGEKPRKAQAALFRRLEKKGHHVHVVDSFDDFTQLIASHLQST